MYEDTPTLYIWKINLFCFLRKDKKKQSEIFDHLQLIFLHRTLLLQKDMGRELFSMKFLSSGTHYQITLIRECQSFAQFKPKLMTYIFSSDELM